MIPLTLDELEKAQNETEKARHAALKKGVRLGHLIGGLAAVGISFAMYWAGKELTGVEAPNELGQKILNNISKKLATKG